MSNKYEREIEELLRRLDPLLPHRTSQGAQSEQRRADRGLSGFRSIFWAASPGHLAAFALAFLFLAYVSRFVEPVLGRYLVIGSIFLFAWGIIVARARAASSGLWQRWQAGLESWLEEKSLRWQEWLRRWFEKGMR